LEHQRIVAQIEYHRQQDAPSLALWNVDTVSAMTPASAAV